MQLDVRVPIGWLFAALGALLAGYGAISNRAIYQQSLGVNINLVWGVVMLAFGVLMLFLGRQSSKNRDRATETQSQKI
jgi:sulfite exporter TauE/SafE